MTTFVTVNQLAERQPALKVGGIRHLIFNEETNGLKESGAISRLGKKILIDEGKFIAWIKSAGGAK